MAAGRPVGKLIVELDLDPTAYTNSQKKILAGAKEATGSIEQNFSKLGVKVDAYYDAMAKSATNSYNLITQRAKSSAEEQFRAQSAAIAKINALNAERNKNPLYDGLGIRSTAAIEAEKKAITSYYDTIKNSGQASAQDLINIERAKNAKLKELNKEMVGAHEMSMASMARAVLRAYAAFYVLQTAVQGLGTILMGGVKAIDDLKINTIAVASTLTSMQGTTGNIVENYRQNLVYADALNKKLMEVDANSFANYEQLQLMNRAMNTQGVVLDSNNKKQVEAFTAISNTIALLTTGQNKEMQASQEMNALMTGRIKATDRVAMMIDGIIKQEGKYKDGLVEVIKLGKEHGDTLQRLEPYLRGITVASGDIGSTWAAVTSSMETAWGIVQRGLFKDIYATLTEQGRNAAQYIKDHGEEIVITMRAIFAPLGDVFSGIFSIVKGILPIVKDLAPAVATIAYGWGGVFAAMKPIGEFLGNSISLTWELVRMIGNAAMAIGSLATGQFAVAKEAWNAAKDNWENIGGYLLKNNKILTEGIADSITKYANSVKAAREASGLDKLMEFAAGGYTPKINPAKSEDPEKALSTARNKLQEVRNEIREAYEDAISKTKQWAAEMRDSGANEFDVIANIYMRRNEAIDEAYNREKTAIQNSIMLADEKGKILAKLDRENTQRKNQADEEFLKGSISYYDRQVSIVSDAYKAIGDYSEASMKAQIAHIEETYIERLRYVQEGSEKEIVILKALEEEKFKIRNEAQKKLIDMQLSYLKDIGKGSSKEAYELEKEKIKNEADMLERQFKNAGGMSEEAVKKLSGEKQYTDQLREEYQQRLLDRAEYLRGMGEKDAAKEAEESAKALAERKIELQNKVTENAIKGLAVQFDKAKWLDEQMRELDSKYFTQKADLAAASLGSMSDALQSIGSMYAEGSDEQKRFFEMAKAFALAQTVIETSKAVVLGVEAVISAMAAGDGYTAVARGAAVAAAVASCLSQIGVAFNGPSGGGSVEAAHPAMGNSTVLGAEYGAGSESLQNSIALLEDTYSMEETKLTKIYDELKDLNGNITGLVTTYIRTGGNMTADDFGVALGTFTGDAENAWKNFDEWTKAGFMRGTPYGDNMAKFAELDIVGSWVNKEIGKIIGDLFGGGQEVWSTGSGIALGRSTVGGLMGGGGAGARGYQDITKRTTTDPWRKDSYDYETLYRDLDSNVTRMFDQVYQGLGATLLELAKQFGTDTQAALNYAFEEAKINLADMTGEEMNKALQEYISKIGDEAAEALFGGLIGKYQQLNEGMLETATRLATDMSVVGSMLEMTGQSIKAESVVVAKTRQVVSEEWRKWERDQTEGAERFVNGMMGNMVKYKTSEPAKYITETYYEIENGTARVIEFTESLIKLAGGLENLSDSISSYYDKFYTEEEKQGRRFDTLKNITSLDNFQQYGDWMGLTGEEWRGINQYMILSSREGFRSIVEGLDLTTNAGREAYVAMLNLSDIADQYYSELEEQQQKAADLANDRRSMEIKIMELEGKASEAVAAQRQIELNALDETLRPLQERIYALQDEKTAAEAAAEAAQKEAQALEEAAAKAAAIAKQRRGIEIDIMEASGLTAEATAARRADELAELDESLRPLKMRYYALLDEQAAMEAAKEAEQARSTAMQKASDDAAEYAEKMEDLRDIFRRVDPAGVRFAETLATIAGNLDELTSSMQTYYDEFFSDKEKRSILKGELTSALSGYGLSLPGSRGDYRELIESMDKDTSYGLRAYAALIEQVKKADTYYDYLDSARSQIKEGDYASRLDYQRAIYGFADGGDHEGGWRIVGERGWELENVGRSHVVSHSDSVAMLDNRELTAEVKELNKKVAELTAYAYRTQENTRKSANIHDEWNENGVPLQS